MKRRNLLQASFSMALLPAALPSGQAADRTGARRTALAQSRARPGSAGWPRAAEWKRLHRDTGGRLLKLESPFADCAGSQQGKACSALLANMKNPYFVGDTPALTQTSGWLGAWDSRPSAYAVAAANTADVVAAVNFARTHNLRLVVKGGGHSYLGTSNAPDSLLLWTRAMNSVALHDAFVAQNSVGTAPRPAVTIGAGAMWADAYAAVTTRGGRYVQGGGCTTVGVAGLIQSGGFGSHSKNFGTASSNLLEAEVVTADGQVRIANAFTNPDLFWAIKGGGGGSFGIVTRVTLKTHQLPQFFGGAFGEIKAKSDAAYRALIAKMVEFYGRDLFNRHWGESIAFTGDNVLRLSMVFQGLDQAQAEAIWAPFLAWVREREEYAFNKPVTVVAMPARHYWDGEYFRKHAPGVLVNDDRANASPDHVVWNGDLGQVGWFIHSYQSAWMPASLLTAAGQAELVDALFAASRRWDFQLHFNKALGGASAGAVEATRDTAMNPKVLDAFALAIIAGGGGPAYPDMPGRAISPNAESDAGKVSKAMGELLRVAPGAGAYVSESDYFQRDWQDAYWGTNYPRLAAVKRKYDPDGLFFVHHGVGSEHWSPDGFTRA